MKRASSRAVVALAFAGLTALATPTRPARAFVRTHSLAGAAAAWRTPHVVLHVPTTADRPVSRLSNDDVVAAASAAVAIWSHEQVDCTSVETSTVADAPRDALPQIDGQCNLIFREDSWSPKTFDKDGKPLADYEPNQLALTSAFIRGGGEIVEADIEINAYSHPVWERSADMSQLIADGAVDLQNTIAHEFGHVLGLDHSCWLPLEGARPLDTGVPVPACDERPDLAAATMAPTSPPGDVGKRALGADDRGAICDVYPFGQPSKLATPSDEGGGCAVAGRGTPRGALLLLAAALLLARQRARVGRAG